MILKLGLDNDQTDLPVKSFSLAPNSRNDKNKSIRTADNTLHIDYTPVKTDLTLTWDVIKQSDVVLLESIYNTQVTSLQSLVFTYEDSLGTHSYSVYMPPVSVGATTFVKGYSYGLTIELQEL